jgi:hypothetical protein
MARLLASGFHPGLHGPATLTALLGTVFEEVGTGPFGSENL